MTPRSRTLVVGDVHGCLEELLDLLDRVNLDLRHPDHRLISVGDLIRRGPSSGRVLHFFMTGGHSVVLGNHELSLLESLRGQRALNPADDALISDSGFSLREVRDWLEAQPLYLQVQDAVVVHAGLQPGCSELERMSPRVLAYVRQWNVRRNQPGNECDPPWFEVLSEELLPRRRIIFGHWAARGLVNQGRFRGLDSGCYAGRLLTGYILEEDVMVSVPSRQPRLHF